MTSQVQSSSVRIASNTIVLFVRMFVLTVINLYAVRLILKGLGEEDYGIFTTVGGVVTSANILSGVLALSIQRYYSFSMGKDDTKGLNEIFSISINIIVALSLLTFIVLETVGLWFVCTHLSIPDERMTATLIIYQFSIFVLICSILQIPYTAAIFSHEDMGFYAFISTIECLLKFAAAALITYAVIDNLTFYVGGLLFTAVIILLIYAAIGRHKYDECHYHPSHNRQLYRELLSFSGWTLLSSVASTGMIQGNTILLNIYYGTLMTAAFGIAMQINNAFNSLSNSMVLAFRPPMIKAYAIGNTYYLSQLFNISTKFIFYILLAVSIPLIIEMDSIIALWIGNTSAETVLYCRLTIIYIVILALHSPITIIMQATNKIKQYHLAVESITVLCLPVTWVLFRIGLPSYFVFISMITICSLAHIIRLICLKYFFQDFSISIYLFSFVFPAVIITIICFAGIYSIQHYMMHGWLHLIGSAAISTTLTAILGFLFGLNKEEKSYLKDKAVPLIKEKLWIR